MIVCLCHRVSDRDIAREARAGCADFDALQDRLKVGTACGACRDCARECFDAEAGIDTHRGCAAACGGLMPAPLATA